MTKVFVIDYVRYILLFLTVIFDQVLMNPFSISEIQVGFVVLKHSKW